MPVERREQVIAVEIGSTGNGRSPIFNGRRQPSSVRRRRGEGNLKVNATQVTSIAGDRDLTEVFRDLEKIAEDYECAHQQVPQGLKSK